MVRDGDDVMSFDEDSTRFDQARPDWLDRLTAMPSGPLGKCDYLDDVTLREILAEADEGYRRAERDLRRQFPELYRVRKDAGI